MPVKHDCLACCCCACRLQGFRDFIWLREFAVEHVSAGLAYFNMLWSLSTNLSGGLSSSSGSGGAVTKSPVRLIDDWNEQAFDNICRTDCSNHGKSTISPYNCLLDSRLLGSEGTVLRSFFCTKTQQLSIPGADRVSPVQHGSRIAISLFHALRRVISSLSLSLLSGTSCDRLSTAVMRGTNRLFTIRMLIL